MMKTAVALFENPAAAETAAAQIESLGFPRLHLRSVTEPLDFAQTGMLSIPHIEFEVDLTRELMRMGAAKDAAEACVDGIRHGGVLVLATGEDEDRVGAAAGILRYYGARGVLEVRGGEPVLHRTHRETPLPHPVVQTGRIRQSSDGARMFVW